MGNYGDGLYGNLLYGYGEAPTLSVTAITSDARKPGYQITINNLEFLAAGYRFTVTRVSDSVLGTSPIRGMDTVTIVTDSVTQTDYEFSFLEDFHYNLSIYDITGTLLATLDSATFSGRDSVAAITSQIDPFWPQVLIRSTQLPDLNQLVQINEFSSWSIAGRVLAQHNVLGRRNPVVLTDKSGGRSGSFIVALFEVPNNDDDQENLEQLLTYGDTYMFQCLYHDPRFKDMFFKVTDMSVERLTKAGYSETYNDTVANTVLFYTINYIEVDRPSTAGETFALKTWQNIKDGFATWQDVKDANATWLDVLNL
jgi:hypothetical protein